MIDLNRFKHVNNALGHDYVHLLTLEIGKNNNKTWTSRGAIISNHGGLILRSPLKHDDQHSIDGGHSALLI